MQKVNFVTLPEDRSTFSLPYNKLTSNHIGGYFYERGRHGVSGQAAQPVPLASLKLNMAVYGQKLDGRPSR